LRGFSGSNALQLLEGKFEEKKARKRPRRTTHGLMACCNGHRKTSIMK